MENTSFKNFNYTLIDSARVGYKEVLVTYIANNQRTRHVLFIKEVKGKNNAYYINEAKKQIESRVNSGTFTKSVSKQLKHVGSKGILKPVMVTLAAALGIGALGAGGYFTYKYFTTPGGGDTPQPEPPGPGPAPTTGHTVVLLAGEGAFEGGKTYLIFNNVPDGTKLTQIEGYALPESTVSYSFDKWGGDSIIDGTPASLITITEDIALTALYVPGVNYLKAQAVQNVAAEYKYIEDNYGELFPDDVRPLLLSIYNKSVETINKIEDSTDPTVIDDARNTINDLKDFAIDTLTEATAAGFAGGAEAVEAIEGYYETSLEKISTETNTVKRAIMTKFDSAYVQAVYNLPDTTILESTYDTFNGEIAKLDFEVPQDVLRARLLSHSGNAAIAATGFFKNAEDADKEIQKIMKISDTASSQLIDAGVSPDDTDTVDWMGDIVRNKCYSELKYRYYDPDLETGDPSYEEYVTDITETNFTAALDYVTGKITDKKALIDINLGSSIAKALANVKILGDDYFANYFPSVQYFVGNIGICSDAIIEVATAMLGQTEEFDELINKIIKCFTNSLEAFSIWTGEKQINKTTGETWWTYDYLFAHSKGKKSEDVLPTDANGTVLNAITSTFDIDKKVVLDESALLDSYVILTEKAIDIAKAKEYDFDGEKPLDYTMLSDNDGSELFIIEPLKRVASQQLSSTFKKEYYKMVLPLINQAIATGADVGFNFGPPQGWEYVIFPSYIDGKGIVSNDFANFLTASYLGVSASTCAIYKKACESLVPGSNLSYVVSSGYFYNSSNNAGIVKIIRDLSVTAAVEWYIKNQPNVAIGFGELINDLLTDGTVDLYNTYVVPTNFDELNNITSSMLNDYGITFGGVLGCLENASKSGTMQKDSLYMIFYDTVRELFATIPVLGSQFKDTMLKEFFPQICGFYGVALDKAGKLKMAIEDNFINVISSKMSEDDYKIVAEATIAACKKIIDEK